MGWELRVLKDWYQTKKIIEGEETPVGPFNCWECEVLHPVELRRYKVDLKQLETHWRMRVFFKNIRTGHRFMKAVHPVDLGNAQEAQFLALKFLKRYFEEQLALYNAVCIIHIGRKHTGGCEACDESDHSQHLDTEQRALKPYEGMGFARKAEKEEGEEYCNQCLGTMDIEAYLKFNLCPWCRVPLPETQEEYDLLIEKAEDNFTEDRGLDAVPQPKIDT